MADTRLSVPEIAFIAVTRVALGVGIGLLVSRRLTRHERKTAGIALALVGGITTIPFAIKVRGLRRAWRRDVLSAA